MHRPVLAEVATINARLAPASTPLSSRGDLRQRGPVFPGVRNAGIDTRGPATPRSGFATARPGRPHASSAKSNQRCSRSASTRRFGQHSRRVAAPLQATAP